jgi:hypothetical protein
MCNFSIFHYPIHFLKPYQSLLRKRCMGLLNEQIFLDDINILIYLASLEPDIIIPS